MSKTITLSKTEYERLRQMAERYKMIRKFFELEFFVPPSSRDIRKIIKEFRATGLYNEAFLQSLARGLKESQYFARSRARNKSALYQSYESTASLKTAP